MFIAFIGVFSAFPSAVAQIDASEVIAGPNSPSLLEDIDIVVDLAHSPIIEQGELLTFLNSLNATFGQATILNEGTRISYSSLQVAGKTSDILVIIAPTTEYRISEIDAIQEYLDKGNSLLLFGANNTQTFEILNMFSEITGFYFQNTTERGIKTVSEISEPLIPAMKGISQIISPIDAKIVSNTTLPSGINEVYPLIGRADYTIAMASELVKHGRIVGISSCYAINDSFMTPVDDFVSIISPIVENDQFVEQILEWLGGATGFLRMTNAWTDSDDKTFLPGKIVRGNVTVATWENETLSHLRVRLIHERTGFILASTELACEGSDFWGSIDTKDMTVGLFDIQFKAERRGYYSLTYTAGRAFITRQSHLAAPTNIALLAMGVSAIIITIISIGLAYRYYWMIPIEAS